MREVASIPATAGLNHNDHKFFHLQASQVWLQFNTPRPQIPGRLLPDWKAARQLLSSHRHSARLLSVYSHLTNSPLNSRSNSRTMAKSTTGFWMRKVRPRTKLNFFQMITELPFSTRQRTLKQLFSRKNVQLWFCQVPQCQNEGSEVLADSGEPEGHLVHKQGEGKERTESLEGNYSKRITIIWSWKQVCCWHPLQEEDLTKCWGGRGAFSLFQHYLYNSIC